MRVKETLQQAQELIATLAHVNETLQQAQELIATLQHAFWLVSMIG